jgi:hypothetical protein
MALTCLFVAHVDRRIGQCLECVVDDVPIAAWARRHGRMEPADHRDPDHVCRLRDDADLVDVAIDPMTMTPRLGLFRLHFFLIPARTCRISALLLRSFQM